jgi:hypothetical protein
MGIFFKVQRDTLGILNYPKLSKERETRSCVMWRHVRPMERKNYEYWPFLMKMILDSPIVPLGTSNFDMLYYVKTFLSLVQSFNVGICEFLHEVCHFVMYLSRTLWQQRRFVKPTFTNYMWIMFWFSTMMCWVGGNQPWQRVWNGSLI